MKTLWLQRLKLFMDMSWHAMGLLTDQGDRFCFNLQKDQGDRSLIFFLREEKAGAKAASFLDRPPDRLPHNSFQSL